ncbi:MAG: glycosyltransferase family 39 protein [Sedimentisphaerales bacterium]|nr:glycosyltransferase family 39 protein [Sedimentisphaerales bacterium]
MSRRKSNSPRRIEPKKVASGSRIDWRRWFWPVMTLIVGGIPFVAYKIYEFSPSPFDSPMNVYSAQQIVNGERLGQSVIPAAQPATLLVNVIGVAIFGFSETGPKVMQLLFQLTALVLMFLTLRKIYSPLAACLAVILAAFYLSCPPYAKFGNAKEQFMIPCMIIAACAAMRRAAGGRWLWMLLAGGAAFNSFFFKQTGASITIALLVFLSVRLVLDRGERLKVLRDIGLLAAGAVIGAIPLVLFNAWQGNLIQFLAKIPGLAFLQGRAIGSAVSGGAYLQASREVSDIASQYDQVMRHYHALLLIIGLGLIAIGWRLKRLAGNVVGWLRRREPLTRAEVQDRLIVLLGVWWLCDLAFVWVSPRSYVEYFLPLLGSGAMLSAYVVYRSRENIWGLAALVLLWPTLDVFCTLSTINASGFPLTFGSAPQGYWKSFIIRALAPLVVLLTWIFSMEMKRVNTRQLVRRVVFTVMAFALTLVYIAPNVADLFDRVGGYVGVNHAAQESWRQCGRYIREHSTPEDKIYVWGWIPGVYVEAQRFSPVTIPAYGDMHTDPPNSIERRVRKMIEQMQADMPLYIVDTQKVHFPFYDHPVFDLWPRWADRQTGKFDLRVHPALYGRKYPPYSKDLLSASEAAATASLYLAQVEALCQHIMTLSGRPGGPLAADDARQLADLERQRHQAMLPLREFVMTHYQPERIFDNMWLFKRRLP